MTTIMTNNTSITVNEYSLLSSICRESFPEYVKYFWDTIIPEKLIYNWHMEELAKEMQYLAERVFRGLPKLYDFICNVPPGTSKSTIASILFPTWVWTRMPSARFICGSYAYPLAMDLSRKARDVIKSEKYKLTFPEITWKDDQDSKGYFANNNGGFRYAVGINGTITGLHAHFIIVDDPIDPNRTSSDAELRASNVWIDETLSQRKVDKSITAEILIMQRLHQDDPTGNRLSKKGDYPVRHFCLPAELSEDVKPEKYKLRYVNGLLDPNRIPVEVLNGAKVRLGEFGYSCQYRQNPIPRGGGMFKMKHMKKGTPPERKYFKKIIRYWDKAASTVKGSAYTVGVKMGKTVTGEYWILDVIRVQLDSGRREILIKQTAKTDLWSCFIGVEQEPGSGGKESAQSTVKNLAGYKVRVDRVTGDKILRADPFSSQVNAGNVYIAEGEWNKDFIEEMRFFPHSKYKDQIDAASGAFSWLAKGRMIVGAL